MINAICILYFRDDEIFDVIGKGIKLSENKKIITKMDNIRGQNNYGIVKIESASNLIYQWELRFINFDHGILFGITSNQTVKSFGDHHYAFTNLGKKTKTNDRWKSYGETVRAGDIVSIHLDLNKDQIKLAINGKDQGIAYDNIDRSQVIKYQLFVCLRSKNDCVEILNFSKQ